MLKTEEAITMDSRSHHCPNCSAPLSLMVGDVEAVCDYCGSRLRFIPGAEEIEVVRTREEMKYRERVAVQKQILRNKLEQEEMERWRAAAGKVAVAALPVIGDVAGRALFGAAMQRGGGCLGCGCASVVIVIIAGAILLVKMF
jgi:DNA-directed RNA polymerase subunit RPC12/RpoP